MPGEEIHRQYEDILLEDDLRTFISSRYGSAGLNDVEMQKIVNKLSLIPATPIYESNREAFRLVNEGFDLVRDDLSQVALHVEYIDYDHPENNIFKVVNQYSVQGERLRRPDLLIFINGIPVGICEFKTAIEEDTTIHDAWEQITIRYKRDIQRLLKYCFLSVISDGANTRLGSIFTPYKFYYSWNKANDQDKVSNGISSLFTGTIVTGSCMHRINGSILTPSRYVIIGISIPSFINWHHLSTEYLIAFTVLLLVCV